MSTADPSPLLQRLGITPCAASRDYVTRRQQFHLHTLLTEQRHPATTHLGTLAEQDVLAALRAVLEVDADVVRTLERCARDPGPLEDAAAAVAGAIQRGARILVYGCGATGRLAVLLESALWRPFWRRVRAQPWAARLADQLPESIEAALVGEITGGDRALVSSLEGFEDLPQVGELQLAEHGIGRDDVVFAVTEGGETSSVIGALRAARDQQGALDPAGCEAARHRLFFVHNNPDEVLRPFDRSRAVLDDPAITVIDLTTGPQALAGSTRMQATTVGTFALGAVLEEAIARVLQPHLQPDELAALGLEPCGLADRLRAFGPVRAAVARALPELTALTQREAAVYRAGGKAVYWARDGVVSVFTDCTERSPTFRLHALDPVDQAERSWVRVCTAGADAAQAWRAILGRPFRGLDAAGFGAALQAGVDDPELRDTALRSLAHAGPEQQHRYDFSCATDGGDRPVLRHGDLGVVVLLGDEAAAAPPPAAQPLVDQAAAATAPLAVVRVAAGGDTRAPAPGATLTVDVALPPGGDPLGLRRQVAVKLLLNAHSTVLMARLGRVVGNTMTSVSPSNLKLIGRATHWIQSHVEDVRRAVCPAQPAVTFADANAVLFDAMRWTQRVAPGEAAEVALGIVRLVSALRGAAVTCETARDILAQQSLASFLADACRATGPGAGRPPAPR